MAWGFFLAAAATSEARES